MRATRGPAALSYENQAVYLGTLMSLSRRTYRTRTVVDREAGDKPRDAVLSAREGESVYGIAKKSGFISCEYVEEVL